MGTTPNAPVKMAPTTPVSHLLPNNPCPTKFPSRPTIILPSKPKRPCFHTWLPSQPTIAPLAKVVKIFIIVMF